ncbi:YbaN family protein [Pseudooceanicola nanhaiensis]|uniref:YbaN family protein n=1 Tax=Pseudooceanicola nanhaiensis TaxID=375761 RepID=UPI001CD43020|nr:YbaN family protein [Pseudooceanicola nanhaiensis]MCA0920278.1 YbaN family protein [Pseudooceanicola nanhaiensis]
MRTVWFLCGLTAVLLGLIGAALPIMPTVPFMLLGAFCFARSSERLHDWLMTHPTFGPPIHHWHETGSVTKKTKQITTISVFAGFCVSLALGFAPIILLIQALVLCGVLIFIWTRPTAPN